MLGRLVHPAAARPTRELALVVLGMVTTAPVMTLCEEPGVWDTLLPKNSDGSVCWDKVPQQVTDSLLWDKVAKATGQKIQGALDSGIPTNISYGFVSGFCSGYALKKVGRAVSVVLGLGFMGLQTLQYYGYVNVDHRQLQSDFTDILDLNKDGKVDTEDGKLAYNHLMETLKVNLPAGGGFTAGFVGGVRSG